MEINPFPDLLCKPKKNLTKNLFPLGGDRRLNDPVKDEGKVEEILDPSDIASLAKERADAPEVEQEVQDDMALSKPPPL